MQVIFLSSVLKFPVQALLLIQKDLGSWLLFQRPWHPFLHGKKQSPKWIGDNVSESTVKLLLQLCCDVCCRGMSGCQCAAWTDLQLIQQHTSQLSGIKDINLCFLYVPAFEELPIEHISPQNPTRLSIIDLIFHLAKMFSIFHQSFLCHNLNSCAYLTPVSSNIAM